MTECGWFPCPQETFAGSVFCYFHLKRAKGLIGGYVRGPGASSYTEPTPKVQALIAKLEKEEDEAGEG